MGLPRIGARSCSGAPSYRSRSRLNLKPFQLEGAAFLAARTRALLADEPGCGKSAQLIRACELVDAKHVRVVCPGVGIEHWRREFSRWWTDARRPVVEVLSYDDARRLAQGGASKMAFVRADVLVVDESHMAKNPGAQRTVAVFGKGGLGHFADRIWCASGTPAPNNASELYPMLKAFGAIRMDYDTFRNYFCIVDAMGKVRGNRPDRVAELRAILLSVSLRRRKVDVLPELGAVDVQEWFVEPNPAFIPDGTRPEIAAQEQELRRQLSGKSFEDMLAALAGDKEFATLRRYNAMLKAPAVFEQVKFEVENGLLDKVTIYGYHKEPLKALEQRFNAAGIGAVLIYGDTPARERDALIEGWKKPDGPRVNLSSIIVAGMVLDYTAAHQGIMLEMDWVNGNNQQAMQRMHRQGQAKPVTVRVAVGSEIDEIVSTVLVRKAKDFFDLFDGE